MLRIGHRGAAALAPENSLAAIEVAAEHGVDVVELDVLRGTHGELVLAHGPEIPHDAPSLDDGLALAARLGLAVQLDVKLAGIEAGVVEALGHTDRDPRSFISSFSLPILAAFEALAPELPRSYTYPEDRLGVTSVRLLRPAVRAGLVVLRAALPRRLPAWLRAAGASAATLNWTVVSPAVVSVCHELGVSVYAWTVNDRALAKTLLESGIDGIITDDPGIFAGET
ncbi:MAG TPA: glycerophosphodiester phosphodiesterase [Gaiellaceae bacterium]|nr:glycerophosphodiester phosphodiesterase [Gaiellaceae bacterium]